MATYAMPQHMTPMNWTPRALRALFTQRGHFPGTDAERRVRIASTLAWLASLVYGLAVLAGAPVPRAAAPIILVVGIAVDVLLIAAVVLHFHFVIQPGARHARSPSVVLLQIAVLVALFLGLWQPLPMQVWAVTAPAAVAAMWLGYAAGWALLLLRAQRPVSLVAGVALIEWSAPTLSLGHLVFAAGLTAFVVVYRTALARHFRLPGAHRARCRAA